MEFIGKLYFIYIQWSKVYIHKSVLIYIYIYMFQIQRLAFDLTV